MMFFCTLGMERPFKRHGKSVIERFIMSFDRILRLFLLNFAGKQS